MKTSSTTILFSLVFLFSFVVNAQNPETCDCKNDVRFLVEKIEEMPSYKKQVKGNKTHPYYKKKNALLTMKDANMSVLKCYKLLNSLTATFRDNHAWIRQTGQKNTQEQLKDSIWITNYRNSDAFQSHPTYGGSIEELQKMLMAKPAASIEGIYHYEDVITIGITQTEMTGSYIGVVMNTKYQHWQPGQVLMYLETVKPDYYNVMNYSLRDKHLRFLPQMLYFDGTILGYFKKDSAKGYALFETDKPFQFKEINENTQYIHFKHFARTNANIPKFKAFLEEMKVKLTATNVIIDLRNNLGGAAKLSDPFLKVLRGKNIYVLTNYYTGSNGEQFTLKLKKIGAVQLGQRTNGTIAYGNNYGTTYTLPSGHFEFSPTDMNFHKYVDYERVGVQPDVELDLHKDWMAQTLEIIAKQKS